MKGNKTYLLLLFVALILLSISCLRDEFTREYDMSIYLTPTINVPVAYGRLTLEDMLNEFDTTAYVETDDSGLVYFAYRGPVNSFTAEEWINIPDQKFPDVYVYQTPVDIPGWTLGGKGDILKQPVKKENFVFEFENNQKLDSMRLKSGFLNIHAISSLHHKGILYIYSPKIKTEDSFYRDTINISDPSGMFDTIYSRPLNKTTVYLDNQTNPDTSFLEVDFELYILNSGEDILTSHIVRVSMTFTDMEYQSVFGYAGNMDSTLYENETIDPELFDASFEGTVEFADPRFNLFIDNSFGFPLGIEYTGLKYADKNGPLTDIVFTPPEINPFITHFPAIEQFGQTVKDTFYINKQNSTIEEAVTTELDYITYGVKVIANPGSTDERNDFFLDTSKVSLYYELLMPMDLRANNFRLEDTVDMDLPKSLPGKDEDFTIDAVTIYLDTRNGMPTDIIMQLTFVDSAYNVLDSIFTDGPKNIMPSGRVESGRVVEPSDSILIIDYPPDQFDQIRDTKYALVSAKFETTNQGQTMVKFYSNYFIGFKLGLRIQARLDLPDKR